MLLVSKKDKSTRDVPSKSLGPIKTFRDRISKSDRRKSALFGSHITKQKPQSSPGLHTHATCGDYLPYRLSFRNGLAQCLPSPPLYPSKKPTLLQFLSILTSRASLLHSPPLAVFSYIQHNLLPVPPISSSAALYVSSREKKMLAEYSATGRTTSEGLCSSEDRVHTGDESSFRVRHIVLRSGASLDRLCPDQQDCAATLNPTSTRLDDMLLPLF